LANHKPILQPLWSSPSSDLVFLFTLPDAIHLELNFYALVKNYLLQLWAWISRANWYQNNFDLDFLLSFLHQPILIPVDLSVNLKSVRDVGMETKRF
jgi:hypothetical protein